MKKVLALILALCMVAALSATAFADGYTIRNNICPEGRYGDNHPGPNVRFIK